MKICVTGGSGFIGSHLIESLCKADHIIFNIDIMEEQNFQSHKHFKNSILDKRIVAEVIAECDFVFHLAAAVGVKKVYDDPINAMKINITGTENILDVCSKQNKNVFIASSSEVYGTGVKFPFSEEDDVCFGSTENLRWNYAYSKAIDEMYALALKRDKNLKVVIGRFFNTVGPRQEGRYGMVLPNFIKAAQRNLDLKVHGNGLQSRCFCHVEDTVKILSAIMDRFNECPTVMNIGSNYEISILDLAKKVIELCSSESKIKFTPYDQVFDENFKDLMRRVPDLDRLQKFMGGFSFQSVEKIIEDMSH